MFTSEISDNETWHEVHANDNKGNPMTCLGTLSESMDHDRLDKF